MNIDLETSNQVFLSTALRTCNVPESLECFRASIAAGFCLQVPNTPVPIATWESANGEILIDNCRSDLEKLTNVHYVRVWLKIGKGPQNIHPGPINPTSLCFVYLKDHTKIISASEFDEVLIAYALISL